jgi:hypothetical protein
MALQFSIPAIRSTGTSSALTRSVGRGVAGLLIMLAGSFSAVAAGATTAVTVSITASSNGHVITVNPGTNLDVTLGASSWTFRTVGTRKVVVFKGTTYTTGSKPVASTGATHICVTFTNCGSAQAHYLANEAGLIRLLATRTSCGTGVVCTASESHWTAVIRVR